MLTITTKLIEPLSATEAEVFRLYGNGFTTREVAERLSRSSKTIDTHRCTIARKLGLGSNNELIATAATWIALNAGTKGDRHETHAA